MLPVLGGISGCTRTTCNAGWESALANGVIATRQVADERSQPGRDHVLGDLVVRRAQEARRFAVLFDDAVQDMVVPDAQRARVERFAAAVVELDPQRAVGGELGRGDDV